MLPTTRPEISAAAAEEVQRFVHKLQIHQMELESQNQELREAQVELADSPATVTPTSMNLRRSDMSR